MKSDEMEASPAKSVLKELETLRGLLKETLAAYGTRLDEELQKIGGTVEAKAQEKISQARLRDMRDMLTLLRTLQVKPDKGRRKDLKKLDSVIGDLSMLIEHW